LSLSALFTGFGADKPMSAFFFPGVLWFSSLVFGVLGEWHPSYLSCLPFQLKLFTPTPLSGLFLFSPLFSCTPLIAVVLNGGVLSFLNLHALTAVVFYVTFVFPLFFLSVFSPRPQLP